MLWAPETPPSVVDAWEEQFAALNGADIDDIDGRRWTSTSTDAGPLGQGDPTTLTWSIMPDGAEIDGFNFEPPSPSNLQSRLNTLYGSIDTWRPLFQQVFDRWEFLSGIDFVFESNDDGSPMGEANVGLAGVRGDLRIGGHFIDGNSNILAYNFFPHVGDMVIDTADNFLDDLAGNSLKLRTIIAHEVGHGVGLRHTAPLVHQKLMEPFINLNFDGPQHDDALRIQRGYGDRFEGNDTAATAAPIGALTIEPVVLGHATITDHSDVDDYISIDDDSDIDYYSFNLSAAALVDLSVVPVGTLYGTGIHGEGNSELFRSHEQSDLSLVVLASNGTTPLASVNSTGLGGSESVVNLNLQAGQYFVRVAGAQNAAQLYTLSASSNLTVPIAPGTINGSLWNDADADGTRDAGETGLSEWTVFLDTNNNGALDTDETSTETTSAGAYSFTSLAAGTYTVAIAVQTGWQQTFPAATGGGTGPRTHSVTLAAGQTVNDINFGNRLATAAINGLLWNDADGDGTRDTGEAGQAGWTVFLDTSNNGALDTGEPSTVTTSTGAYSFTSLVAGTYTVAIVVQSGWQQTFPAATGGGTGPRTHTVTLAAGQTVNNIDFGNRLPPPPPATINGSLWNDTDGDGIRDAGESGQSGWTVFLDSISNGVLDTGENSTVTTATGTYSFTGLAAGTHTVAIVLQSGWVQTFPAATGGAGPRTHFVTMTAGQTVGNIDFGNRLPPGGAPVLAAIGNQTMPGSQDTLQLNLSATDPNNDPLTFSGVAQSLEYHLDQTLGLNFVGGNEYLNWGGRNEKWLIGAGNDYYITPDGKFYRWLGGSLANDPLVEQLSTAVYANTALLHNATNNAPATLSINGSTLTINPNDGFVGKFFVTATVSDGALTDSELFHVIVQPGPADTTPPTVTNRTPANGATIAATSTNIDVTFSEAVQGVDVTDLVLGGNGSTGAVKGAPINLSGNVWRFPVSNLQNGPVNVSLAPDANDIEDTSGNDLAPVSWSFTVQSDTTPPTVTNRTPANGATITATSTNIDVTFSEAVQGVDVTDLVLSGGGATGAVKGTPINMGANVWRFPVSNLQTGPVNISLAPDANDIEDTSGNDLAPVSWSFTVAVDATPPTVTNRTPANGATIAATSTNIDVTFSETVQGVDVTDLVLGGSGATGAVKGTPTNLGANLWRFPVSNLQNGPVNISLAPDANDIEDTSGNDLAPVSWSFTVAVDTTPPTVTSRTPANGATIAATSTNIDVTFSETVQGVEVTDLVLSGSGSTGVVKGAPVNMGANVWRFPVSNLQNGLVNISLAPDANDIEDTSGNDLAPVSWSFTVASDTTAPIVTSRTPANGATIAATSTNIDVTFSETVQGVDVTDLVLGGSGATGAVKGAPVNLGGNVWRFPVSNLQNGPVNISLAPDAGDIEDTSGNDLAPVSWSFTVNVASQEPPVLATIGDQSMPSTQDTLVLNLTATDANNDPLTFTAVAQSIEHHLDQTLGLNSVGGDEYLNWSGLNEKWLTGAGSTWYYITPDGKLYRWLGGDVTNDPLIDQVSTAAYANTALLHSAQPNNAPASVTVNGSTLTINPNDSFRGKFIVTLTVSDGQGGTDNETFKVTVT